MVETKSIQPLRNLTAGICKGVLGTSPNYGNSEELMGYRKTESVNSSIADTIAVRTVD